MEWRTIPGFPGYVISDKGDLVSPMKTELRPFGDNKDTFCLKRRDGMQRKRRVADLLKLSRRGRVVEDPLAAKLPAGAAPIPGYDGFSIDRKGRVWNSKTGREYSWLYVRQGGKSPRVRLKEKWISVPKLLERTFGLRACVDAGLPPPRGSGDELQSKKYDTPRPKRKCHDCGKPTDDYRCPECRRKWRLKNDVMLADNGGDVESINS